MNSKEQTLISKSLASINDPSMFATFMEYLTNIRNICAHDERLYCYICFMRPPELPLMRYFNLSNKSIKSYFGLVIVLKKFLSPDEFHFFYQNLSKLIVNLSLQIHTIHIKKVLKKMGFPNNWKTIIKGFPKCGTIYSFTLGNLAFWIISFI